MTEAGVPGVRGNGQNISVMVKVLRLLGRLAAGPYSYVNLEWFARNIVAVRELGTEDRPVYEITTANGLVWHLEHDTQTGIADLYLETTGCGGGA